MIVCHLRRHGTTAWANFSGRILAGRARTNRHGYATADIELDVTDWHGLAIYQFGGLYQIKLTAGPRTVFEGEVARIQPTPAGVALAAVGVWAALDGRPYTSLISDNTYTRWRELTQENTAVANPGRYSFDFRNRLYVAPRKDEQYNLDNRFVFWFAAPDKGVNDVYGISFDYDINLSTTWYARIDTSTQNEWVLAADGTNQTGTATVTFSGVGRNVYIFVYFSSSTLTTYNQNTGERWAKFKNVRVYTKPTPIDSDDIIIDVLNTFQGDTTPPFSFNTGQIKAPGRDWKLFHPEDANPIKLIEDIEAWGDGAESWHAAIWDDRRLTFRPASDYATQWYVRADSVELVRQVDELYTEAYATGVQTNGQTYRQSSTVDAANAAQFGLARRRHIATQTPDTAEALNRTAVFLDGANRQAIKSKIRVREVFNQFGQPVPAYHVRALDTLIVTGLAMPAFADGVNQFRIAETTIDIGRGVVDIVPEKPTDTLEQYLARTASR